VEYYDRASRDGADVAFVVGSDVLGPMGPDVVPVARDKVDRFVKDHGGRKLDLADVTAQLL
jgi:copper chaperone NosL